MPKTKRENPGLTLFLTYSAETFDKDMNESSVGFFGGISTADMASDYSLDKKVSAKQFLHGSLDQWFDAVVTFSRHQAPSTEFSVKVSLDNFNSEYHEQNAEYVIVDSECHEIEWAYTFEEALAYAAKMMARNKSRVVIKDNETKRVLFSAKADVIS
jgi:hypothetical protein